VTFFAGDVNFYFERDGKICGTEMTWGASNYIAPFIPHSFTTRDPKVEAFIVAITFAGPLKKALTSSSTGSADSWRRTLEREMLPRPGQEDGLLHHRLLALVKELGGAPDEGTYGVLNGDVGNTAARDSYVQSKKWAEESVQVQSNSQNPLVLNPTSNRQGLQVHQLATPPGYLETTFLHLTFHDLGATTNSLPLAQFTTYRDVYVYCLGPSSELTWMGDSGLRSQHLVEGDSAFIRSFVPFTFSGTQGSELVLAAVPGDISQATLLDLHHHHDIDRTMRETQTWFN
jgi:hypothetical protein